MCIHNAFSLLLNTDRQHNLLLSAVVAAAGVCEMHVRPGPTNIYPLHPAALTPAPADIKLSKTPLARTHRLSAFWDRDLRPPLRLRASAPPAAVLWFPLRIPLRFLRSATKTSRQVVVAGFSPRRWLCCGPFLCFPSCFLRSSGQDPPPTRTHRLQPRCSLLIFNPSPPSLLRRTSLAQIEHSRHRGLSKACPENYHRRSANRRRL